MWTISSVAVTVANAVIGNVGVAIVLGCLVLARWLEDQLEVTE